MANISFVRLDKRNKFGFYTHHINLDSLHRIELHETTNGTYIIEFLELGILWPTRLFAFTSNESIFEILEQSMDRVADYYRKSDKYDVPEYIFTQDKTKVLDMARTIFKWQNSK